MRWLALLVFALMPQAGIAEERIALIIGNADYPAEIGRLTNPLNDVTRMEASLEVADFNDIRVLTEATQLDMNLAIAAFASDLKEAGGDGVGFFYYSGHGASAESSGIRQNYLIPTGVPIGGVEQLPILGVSMTGIIESLSAANAKAVFVVSDACRNTLPFTTTKGGEIDRSFTPVQTRSGLFIAYATADGATAPDDGLFSSSLSRQIVQPGQTASRAFELAFREVAMQRPGNRLPFYSPGLLEDVCFVSCDDQNSEIGIATLANARGKLSIQPVPGKMIRAFGDQLPGGENSSGFSISTAPGTPVKSPISGEIRYVGPFRDTTQLVMIGDQPPYVIVLAGLGSTNVSKGQIVAQGDEIGLMGTESEDTPKLYMEFRRGLSPVDPVVYLYGLE